MKKNKIILLTVLIMLALYCGAVVFVTKPDTFAFSGILGDYNTISGTNKAQLMEEVGDMIDERINAAVNDRIVPYVDSSVGSAVDSAMAGIDGKIEAQVSKAFEALESRLVSEKDALVAQIMEQFNASSMVETSVASSFADPADYVDTLIPALVPAVVAELEGNLDAYAPYIVRALVPELLTYEDALAADLYSSYRDSLVADLTPDIVLGIMDRLEDEVFTFVGSVPNVPAMAAGVKVTVNVKSSEPADASAGEAVVLPLLDESRPVVTEQPAPVVDVDAVVAELEKNLPSYAPYVADAVLPELEKDLEAYLPYIVDAVVKAMQADGAADETVAVAEEPVEETAPVAEAPAADAAPVEEAAETAPMTSEQYDAIREETRRSEIENILSQLQD